MNASGATPNRLGQRFDLRHLDGTEAATALMQD